MKVGKFYGARHGTGDVTGAINFSIVHRHFDLQIGRALDDMLVRHNVARWIDQEPGTETLKCLANLPRPASVISEVLVHEILKRISDASANNAFGVDTDHRWQNLRHGEDGGLRSGIGTERVV